MSLRNAALWTIAVGDVAFVTGLYGVMGQGASWFFEGLGVIALLGGAGLLLAAARPWRLTVPHPCVVAIFIVAAAVHTYEFVYRGWQLQAGLLVWNTGFLVWNTVPYALSLAVSAFPTTRVPAIAGAALAFAFERWTYAAISEGSTGPLIIIFAPLWSTILFVPWGTFAAWYVSRWRSRRGASELRRPAPTRMAD